MMKKLLEINTAVFLFQLVAGAVAYYLSGGSWQTAFLAAFGAAVVVVQNAKFVAVSALFAAIVLVTTYATFNNLGSIAITAILAMAAVLTIFISIFFAYLAAIKEAVSDSAEYTFRFLAALPAGIGPILGWPIYYLLQKEEE